MEQKYKFYPFDNERLVLTDDNLAVLLSSSGHYCGYVAIRNKDIPKEWCGNYDSDALQYLSIHGGITYCESKGDYTVFGFDCAHAGDEENEKLRDKNHIMDLAKQMRQQLERYSKCIDEWREAGREARIDIIQRIRESAKYPVDVGFAASLSMLAGAPEFGKEDDNQ
jgi:hypothetical protein